MSAQLLWQRPNTQNVIFLNPINSIDNTKLSWYTLPPRQHHSFFRKLPLLFIYNYQKSTRIKKKATTTTKTTMIHKGWPKVTLHMISGTKVTTHTTHQHIVQNAHCSRDIYQQQRKIYRSVILAAKCTLESLDWSLITLAFLLRDYNALAHQIILFMLLHVRKKITHSCLCYILDKHSILKPSVTYSFLSTPYSINT